MKRIQQLIKFIISPRYRLLILNRYGFCKHWSDEKYLKRKFKYVFGRELDLQTPQTFNEKHRKRLCT